MSITLPPLPSIRDWPHSHEELRARDLEVARVVLEDALRRAIVQNEHDMLLTGEELRAARAALEQKP